MLKINKNEEMGLIIDCMLIEAEELKSCLVLEDGTEAVVATPKQVSFENGTLTMLDREICVDSLQEDGDTLYINDMYELKFL